MPTMRRVEVIPTKEAEQRKSGQLKQLVSWHQNQSWKPSLLTCSTDEFLKLNWACKSAKSHLNADSDTQ